VRLARQRASEAKDEGAGSSLAGREGARLKIELSMVSLGVETERSPCTSPTRYAACARTEDNPCSHRRRPLAKFSAGLPPAALDLGRRPQRSKSQGSKRPKKSMMAGVAKHGIPWFDVPYCGSL